MICGIVTPDRGSVNIDGLSLAAEPRAAKSRIGLVPQELALIDELPAIDNRFSPSCASGSRPSGNRRVNSSRVLEFYPQIRLAHISCVLMSGSLFLLRGLLLMYVGTRAANSVALRWLSYAIDSTLLAAALMLAVMLQRYPFVQPWLTVKVLLLPVYIGLGYYALHRAATRGAQALSLCAALAVFLFMISVARAHHPLGILLRLSLH